MMTLDESYSSVHCKIQSRFLINSLRMLLYSEHSHKTCSTDSHSHLQKKQALLLFLVYYVYLVTHLDINLDKSLYRTHVRDSSTSWI